MEENDDIQSEFTDIVTENDDSQVNDDTQSKSDDIVILVV